MKSEDRRRVIHAPYVSGSKAAFCGGYAGRKAPRIAVRGDRVTCRLCLAALFNSVGYANWLVGQGIDTSGLRMKKRARMQLAIPFELTPPGESPK